MERREWNQLLERRYHRGIDDHGAGEIESAVHDAMADTDETIIRELGAQKPDQVIERPVMTELRPEWPRLLRLGRSVAPLRDEVRGRVDLLDVTAHVKLELVTAHEQRKLEARRSDVENGDEIGHRTPRWRSPVPRHSPPSARSRDERCRSIAESQDPCAHSPGRSGLPCSARTIGRPGGPHQSIAPPAF